MGFIPMQRLSLRQAAEKTGTNKSTILRAIQSGRLRAERTPSNEWAIDEEELARVYPAIPTSEAGSGNGEEAPVIDLAKLGRSEPVGKPLPFVPIPDAVAQELADLQERCTTLEQQLEAQRQKLADVEAQRDQWKQRCAHLSTSLQAPIRVSEPTIMSSGDGIVALFASIACIWLAVMAGTAAVVDNNDNQEAPVAIVLALCGIGLGMYYLFRKKLRDTEFLRTGKL
jgi:excisionase family DNA binding protein